jgi:phosphatidylinositol-3-phosphatase
MKTTAYRTRYSSSYLAASTGLIALAITIAVPVTGCGGGSQPPMGTPAQTITVSCDPATLAPKATSQCKATVTAGASSSVNWSASTGTIDSNGLFTAPATAGSVTVTASSTKNPSVAGSTTITVKTSLPTSKHVVLVMEENQSYASIVGNSTAWPHLNQLISQGALPTNYFANGHFSIPNYFMLTTGQTLTFDDNSATIWNVDSIARRMLDAKISFRIYAEGIQRGYLGGNTGLYVRRHNPFVMLSDIANNPQVANQVIWPFSQFAADAASHTLPEFSFVIPDLNDDAHNGSPQLADGWLQANVVGPLSGYPAFQPGGDGLLVVDFDESIDSDVTHGGGHVAPVFWGPIAKSGYTQASSTVFQHESMLRTIMELLQLANPPGAAATAPEMTEFFAPN